MSVTNKLVNKARKPSEFAQSYIDRLYKIFKNIEPNSIDRMFSLINTHRKKNKNIFLIGNGGSSSTASHMQNDINFDVLKRSKTNQPFRFLNLSDNSPSVTAISNDISYDQIFSKQLSIFGNKGDMVIAISASGNSSNLIESVKYAKKNGIYTFGMIGFDGGVLKKICDDYILVPTDINEFGIVEDSHLILNHIISHWFQIKLKN